MKTLLTNKFSKDEIQALESLGYDIYYKDAENLNKSDLKGVEVLISSTAFKYVDINDFDSLKWIQSTSTGIDSIPLKDLKKRNILLTNNKNGYSIPIGEWIVLKILEIAKNSKKFYKQQEKKIWKYDNSLKEIYSKKIGFIGTGDIANEASKRLKAFEAELIGFNSDGSLRDNYNQCFKLDKNNPILKDMDYIVITLPLTDKTYKFIDSSFIKNLKPGVSIINVSRGKVVDEEAIIKHCNSKHINMYASDVFFEEPLKKDSPLWDMDQLIITPHNSWSSEMNSKRLFKLLYENMKVYKENPLQLDLIELDKNY